MRKIIFTLLTSIFAITFCYSQDLITKKSSEDIEAKVVEVTTTEIKYKKIDNLDGPVFSMPKSDVLMIRYENGTKDIFVEEKTNETISTPDLSGDKLYKQGQSAAIKNYRGYTGAGTGTLIVSLLSPLVGLIPAVACSSTPPKDKNLNYPNTELMKKPDYYNGYTQKSKKMKQSKVWTNWGFALAVNMVLVLVFSSGQ